MKKVVRMVCLLCSLVVLSACSSSARVSSEKIKEQSNNKADRMLVITSAEPAKVLPAFTTFSWDADYSEVLSAENGEQERAVRNYLRNQIVTYLQTKGYQYHPVAMQADVVIGFLFALQDSPADKDLQTRFGVLPTKNTATNLGYKKGTLLLTVLDTPLTKVYWRSALLGLVDLEQELNAVNQERMQIILNSILGDFPKAGR